MFEGVRVLLRSLDVRTIVIVALLLADAGHAGHLFSVREASDRSFIGYLLAFCLDAASGLALHDMVNVRKRSRRVFALCVFAFAGTVAGAFSLAYYRDNCPGDPVWVSVLMASVAPVLAGLLSVMRAFGHVERAEAEHTEREAERAFELKKYRIAQQERTKQVRANARAERAKAEAIGQVKAQSHGRNGNGRVKPGELDAAAKLILAQQPNIGPRPLARELECSPSTAAGILRRLRDNGHLAKAA